MKKLLFSLILLLVSYVGFSQKGLSYQAVILDPAKIEIPGQDISSQPLVNGDVWLKFSIFNGSTLQFEEVQKTKTDNYGLVNLLIGSVSSASFNSLVWDGSQKSLQVFVSFNQGGSYTKIADQKLTYNPYALFAETAGKLGATLPISGGGTGATTAVDARANLGLDQVNNTSDAAKPVSAATKAALDLKANANDVTAGLALKANTADVTSALDLKANTSDLNAALALKSNSADVTSALDLKADTSFVIAKVAAVTIADADANSKGKIQLAGDLGGTADAPTVPGLALKANTSDVIAALNLKANSVDMTNALALKANGANVSASLNLREIAANKSLNVNMDGSSDIKYPSVKAVKDYVDARVQSGGGSTTVSDADATTKGIIRLTGDLGGTADAPTVPGLALKANATDVSSLTTTVNTNTASITANTSEIALKANTTDVNTALALKAPLASPALSGVPTAPTASAGTNNTQIATTEYTNAAISSALSSTLISVSTTLTSTGDPFDFSGTVYYNGELDVLTTQNLANGVDVLKVNQSGIANVGFGIANLYSNTTGSANTSVGYKGLYSNSTGKDNSSFGAYSLYKNTNGSYNSAFGSLSLISNTTGSFNSAFGEWALLNNTSGIYNVGIGNNVLFSNTIGSSNTASGVDALKLNTTGNNNTAIGRRALASNTTAIDNTAIGYFSLYRNTTGNGNTANGSYSLYSNTTANDNTANGYFSLYWNTTGQKNTASGGNSLKKNTTGSYNTANGYNSLPVNTTGESNTSIGSFSLERNSTGSNNIAIGYYSLNYNTTAGSNTAIGNQSLSNNSTGEENTANGYKSLRFNTGSFNTANGTYSLESNTTGAYNTALGYSAGRVIADGYASNSTSDYSVYLGSNTKASADNAQNEVVIGYNAIGGGSNTVTLGNTSVTKVITSGAITAGSVTYPNIDGSPNQVLSTNGSGTLTWTTLTHTIGESYGGGIVFYVYDNGKHGLIAATSDQTSGIRWYGGSNTNTRARADGVGAGLQNTAIIIANQGNVDGAAFAATVCNEYSVTVNGVTYGDWYLPSKHELNLLYSQKTVVGFIGGSYWSSSENSSTEAWLQTFNDPRTPANEGTQYSLSKSSPFGVRAIRAF